MSHYIIYIYIHTINYYFYSETGRKLNETLTCTMLTFKVGIYTCTNICEYLLMNRLHAQNGNSRQISNGSNSLRMRVAT